MNAPKENLLLDSNSICETLEFTSISRGRSKKHPTRNRAEHGTSLLNQLENVWTDYEQQKAVFASIEEREGTYVEFEGSQDCELVFKSLEDNRQGVKLLNVRDDTESGQQAMVFIPKGKEQFFKNKIDDYLTENTKTGKPKNQPLVESIEKIKLADVNSFWIGNEDTLPNETPLWCEFWLFSSYRKEQAAVDAFFQTCDSLEIEHKEDAIFFPEKAIVLAKTNIGQIKNLIALSSCISEIRRAPECISFFTKMSPKESVEWVNDLINRVSIKDDSNVYVCILDTGVNSDHALLSNAINDNHVNKLDIPLINDIDGHGTNMAGICEYFDLEKLLLSSEQFQINHKIESVKILPDNKDNPPELYGNITDRATSEAEIHNPNALRVYCMAVTTNEHTPYNGAPSSWSAALDRTIFGSEDGLKKLFLISAGNVIESEIKDAGYTSANEIHPVENPGQSWNALTIGAYNSKTQLSDATFEGWNIIADNMQLSPFSSTSLLWNNSWPLKPEILLDGGNAITDGNSVDVHDDVSILTISNKPNIFNAFTSFNATSSATAQASYIAAELLAAYPNLWVESVRGLMVHSAELPEKMIEQFAPSLTKRSDARKVLRCCGYGIADLDRAKNSYDNSVNMVIQSQIQPFEKIGSKYKTKDMHIYDLPWPKDLLQSLENTPVEMKVTLSYFIEPAPESKGWKDKYRYESAGLRFEVINNDETTDDFKKRINRAVREDNADNGDGTSGSDRWLYGKTNRDIGSVHSDIWRGSAVDLSQCNKIAIYPIIGWWRERHNLEKYNEKMRYSLIISLKTPEESVDFYTPITTAIENIVTPII